MHLAAQYGRRLRTGRAHRHEFAAKRRSDRDGEAAATQMCGEVVGEVVEPEVVEPVPTQPVPVARVVTVSVPPVSRSIS